MQKPIPLCCLLLFLAFLPQAANAVESAPVELVNATESDKAVDSALAESMEAPLPPEKKPAKTAASKKPKTAPVAPVDNVAEAVAPVAPSSGEAATIAAADDNYVIQPGDVLQITVWKEDDMDREVLVLPDGSVSFPLIGSFKASGLTPAQVQSTVKHKLHSLIPGASVTVLVKATLGHSVSVIGQVTKPGELIMAHDMTVMQALSQAGGLTPFASESSIIVLRKQNGAETAIDFPYDDVIRGRSLERNIKLQPGDVVVVPTASLF